MQERGLLTAIVFVFLFTIPCFQLHNVLVKIIVKEGIFRVVNISFFLEGGGVSSRYSHCFLFRFFQLILEIGQFGDDPGFGPSDGHGH